MSVRPPQIVAFGGGGFSMEWGNPLLDDHVLALTGVERPKVCFLPTASGDAAAPASAPAAVKNAIAAANQIDTTPYVWGGGHGSFESSGYDCSGAVSFALNGGGFLSSPLDSTGLETWGSPGPGRWITVYANAGHAFAVIAGLSWDTVGDVSGTGPRWHTTTESTAGFIARHPDGY
jgi:hypothetical protein